MATLGSKIGPERWLECNPELWHGLLDAQLVQKVTQLGGEDSWCKASAEVRALIEGSNLGARLFGWISKEISGADIEEVIKKQVAKMLKMESVGHKEIADIMTETMKLLEDIAGVDDLPERREIVIRYRGWQAPRVVRSVQEQVEVNLVSAARGQAAAQGMLSALPGEQSLCGPCGREEVAKIKASYVKHSQMARDFLDGLTKSNECKSGEQLLDRVVVFFGRKPTWGKQLVLGKGGL